MKYDPNKHHRRSIRLKDYDYSQAGAYFITIVAYQRENLFGEIVDGEMRLSDAGQIVGTTWIEISNHFRNVELDEFVVMPNHVHGIIVIHEDRRDVGAIHELPLPNDANRVTRRKMFLPKIIGYFKMNAAKRINVMRGTSGAHLWQRNYYERVIRNETEWNAICQYIANNPLDWRPDGENPIYYPVVGLLH